jgi:hypothetical protein
LVRHAGDHHLSYVVAAPPLHHGIGASVTFFGITTTIISDPDQGIDQLAVHQYRGCIRFRSAHAVDYRFAGHLTIGG